MVADTGLVVALPLWLSVRAKRESDRGALKAQRDLVVREARRVGIGRMG